MRGLSRTSFALFSELPDNYASGSSGDCSTVYELGGGCLCCNLRNDLMAKLEGLGKKALAAPSDDPVNGVRKSLASLVAVSSRM